MTRELVLEEMGPHGKRVVARLQSGETIIGREPDEGIQIGHTAISRNHGVFVRFRNHWFYKDLGSTNGSWINSNAVPHEVWQLVRPGDYLQLADVGITLSSDDQTQQAGGVTGFPALGGRSLLVFSNNEFHDEYPVPEYGRAIVIGGSGADLEIPGDIFEEPALVVERRGDKVVCYQVSKSLSASVNGQPLEETVTLSDRDSASVSDFTVVFNEPEGVSQFSPSPGAPAGAVPVAPQATGGVKDWGDEGTPDLHSRVQPPTQSTIRYGNNLRVRSGGRGIRPGY